MREHEGASDWSPIGTAASWLPGDLALWGTITGRLWVEAIHEPAAFRTGMPNPLHQSGDTSIGLCCNAFDRLLLGYAALHSSKHPFYCVGLTTSFELYFYFDSMIDCLLVFAICEGIVTPHNNWPVNFYLVSYWCWITRIIKVVLKVVLSGVLCVWCYS